MTLILALESSCDETACAIIKDGKEILSNIYVGFLLVLLKVNEMFSNFIKIPPLSSNIFSYYLNANYLHFFVK